MAQRYPMLTELLFAGGTQGIPWRRRCPGGAQSLPRANRVRRPGEILSGYCVRAEGKGDGHGQADDSVARTDQEALHHDTNLRPPRLTTGKDMLGPDQTACRGKEDLHAGASLGTAANPDLSTPSLGQLAGDGET